MSRARHNESESAGGDSFLDIVSNIVGILIILVMVAGARVKNHPIQPPQPKSQVEDPNVAAATASSLAAEVRRLTGRSSQVRDLHAAHHLERVKLATIVQEAQLAIASQEQLTDDEGRRRMKLIRESARTEAQLSELQRRQISAV